MDLDAVLPDVVSVPFSNFDLWNNLETSGLLKAVPDGLVLEFEVVRFTDSLWPEVRSRSTPAEVRIAFDDLESVAVQEGWVQSAVDVRARSLKALSDVPGSKQGQVRLASAEKDKPRAKALASVVAVRLSEGDLRKAGPAASHGAPGE